MSIVNTASSLLITQLFLFVLISHEYDTHANREVLHGFYFSGFRAVGVFSPYVECKLIVYGDDSTYFRSEGELPFGVPFPSSLFRHLNRNKV